MCSKCVFDFVPSVSCLTSLCSITLGGFGADRFYLGQWREGLGKLFSFGGLGIWTLIDVLLIGVGYVGPADGSLYIWKQSSGDVAGWCRALFRLTPLSLSKIEYLRYRVLSTFACPSSLCNTSSSHLLTGRKCFLHYTNGDSTHTTIRSIPITLPPSPVEILQMELCGATSSQ